MGQTGSGWMEPVLPACKFCDVCVSLHRTWPPSTHCSSSCWFPDTYSLFPSSCSLRPSLGSKVRTLGVFDIDKGGKGLLLPAGDQVWGVGDQLMCVCVC